MKYNWKKISTIIALCCCIITVASATIRVVEVTASQQNQATGSITIEVSGTAGPFSVELKDANSNKVPNPVGGFFEEENYEGLLIFMPLPLGTYFIQVFDANGCMTTLEVIIEEAICDVEVYVADIQHVSACSDNDYCTYNTGGIIGCTNDGSIKLEIIATFNHPFRVEWSGRGSYSNTGIEINNLKPGVYQYKVISEDNPSCFIEGEVEVNVCIDDNFFIHDSFDGPDCIENTLYDSRGVVVELEEIRGTTNSTSNDGQIDITIASKTPSFYYYWQDDKIPPNRYKEEDLFNLSIGNYCLTLDDGCSETEEYCFEIIACTENPLVLKPFISRPCEGTNKGKIYLNVEGGTEPYTFLWSNGSEQQDLENIPAGAYNVTVSDFYLCQENTEIIVEDEPNSMNVAINVNPFSQHNIFGEIFIKADGPEQYYSLFIDGFEYFPLKSGRAEKFEFEISKTYLIEVYSSTGCGFEREVFLADCKDDFEKLSLEVLRSDDRACNGGSQLIDVMVSGGAPPYRIEGTTLPQSPESSPTFEVTKTVFEEGLAKEIISAPVGRINVKVTDVCGDVVQQALTICDGICYVYSEKTKSDEITYYVTDFLKFKAQKGCYDDNCGGWIFSNGCSQVKLEGINTNHPLILNRGHELKIIWPNDAITTLGGTIVGPTGGTVSHREFEGKDTWKPDAPGIYTIKVEWTPEDEATCTMEFDVEFSDEGNSVIGFYNEYPYWSNEPWSNTYYGTFLCESCLPSSSSGFVTHTDQCKSDNIGPSIRFFEYHPFQTSNPCNGGGIIQYWAYVNGEIDLISGTIPPNIALDGLVSKFLTGGQAQGIESPNDICNFGGRCLFDALDIFGIELDYPIGLGWCSQPGIYVPPPGLDDPPTDGSTEDDDDIGDILEEEDCVGGITVELDDRGCNYKKICHLEHGQNVVIEKWDNEDVVTICRYITRSGNCTSVRGRCNCTSEKVDGYGDYGPPFHIPDPNGDLCNNPSIISCQDYHIENNCKGSLGIGTGGNFIDDNPNDEMRFITTSDEKFPITRKIYPNPFNNEINMSISSEINKELTISIMDVYGIVIFEDYKDIIPGQNTFTFQRLSNYPSGIYYIAVTDDMTGDTEVKKVGKVSSE